MNAIDRDKIIRSMCITYDSQYEELKIGLQETVFAEMAQIYDTNIAPLLAAAQKEIEGLTKDNNRLKRELLVHSDPNICKECLAETEAAAHEKGRETMRADAETEAGKWLSRDLIIAAIRAIPLTKEKTP